MRRTRTVGLLVGPLVFCSALFSSGCAVVGDFTPSPKLTSGVSTPLLQTQQHWAVEFDSGQLPASLDTIRGMRLEGFRHIYPEDSADYLDQVRQRLQRKYRVSLAENFPNRGFIFLRLYGVASEYDYEVKERFTGTGSAGTEPRRPSEARSYRMHARSKTMQAQVTFIDSRGVVLASFTTNKAAKPKKLADFIADFMKGKIGR